MHPIVSQIQAEIHVEDAHRRAALARRAAVGRSRPVWRSALAAGAVWVAQHADPELGVAQPHARRAYV